MATAGDANATPALASGDSIASGSKSAPKAKKPPKAKTPGGRGGRGGKRGRGGAGAEKKGKGPATEDAEDVAKSKEEQKKRKRGLLTKDLKYMMYGFGDTETPLQETTDLVEDMTIDYLTDFAHRAMEVSARRGRLQTEDLLYLIRNDEKKLQRVNELLDMNVQLKEARKNFDLDEAANAK